MLVFCSYKQYMPPVLAEQKAVMQRHGNKLNFDVLSEMDVLHRSMKEALRLHPPLILLLRYCHKDFSVTTREGKTYTIPKDHIVATSPAFANRLPYIYKDPNTFNPDRFAPGREEDTKAGPFSYISFGGGRHGCLGETFAYMQVSYLGLYNVCKSHMKLEKTDYGSLSSGLFCMMHVLCL